MSHLSLRSDHSKEAERRHKGVGSREGREATILDSHPIYSPVAIPYIGMGHGLQSW